MKKVYLLVIFLNIGFLYAQKKVTGIVTDNSGTKLEGVYVIDKSTNKGTTTNNKGQYNIDVQEGAILNFSFFGYIKTDKQVTTNILDITLSPSGNQVLENIVIVGSRNTKRTIVNSAVPIDVINIKDISTQSGKIEINELLQYVAPSFNANKQSGSDGSDHVDPASLRGLGPDQTLVLINGKRRHQSSLINLFGTRGRGNTGTDLNAIPASAIKKIEILRDGAAAQYGSDAIAGVINIVLNDNVDQFTGSVTYGAFNTNARGDFPDKTANTSGYRLNKNGNGNSFGNNTPLDGGSLKVDANYGVAIGEKGGFANFTAEYLNKNKTLRPGFDFRKGFGEAAIQGFNLFGNLAIPIADNTEFYAFGGQNYRDTDAYAFTRNDGERVVESIYPGGFTPRISSIILDNSVAIGVRTKTSSGWKIDLSNTNGKNLFHYFIKGTINASLQNASPTEFDAGGHSLSQNTTNFDLSKNFSSILKGLNVAFGSEFRTENFQIFSGEEASYATYATNGKIVTDPATQTVPLDPISGKARPGGSQGFPGYSPYNVVNKSRSNTSLYTDLELDVTKSLLISGAVRFENYSDFGNTLNGKMAARIKVTNNINLRGSVSTGFRAPSLAQSYYNLRFTNVSGAGATEVLLSQNNSPVTKAFGIEKLKEEKALNASLGLTANFGDFTATVDGYLINVKNRIVLTGYFDAKPFNLGVDKAQFFVNGVDTKTAGLDIVLSWKKSFGKQSFSATLVGNINNMKINDVKNGSLDKEIFFGEREKAFLLASAPNNKFGLNLGYSKKWFNTGLAFTRFSDVTLIDYQANESNDNYGGSFDKKINAAKDFYSAKIVTDLTLGFKTTKNTKISLGANNLFNIYPDQQDDWVEGGGYWDAVQMGFGGAYYYARLGLNF